MSEDGKLTLRQVNRERAIYEAALVKNDGMRKRSLPLTLFVKLLDAAKWALEHGYDSTEAK